MVESVKYSGENRVETLKGGVSINEARGDIVIRMPQNWNGEFVGMRVLDSNNNTRIINGFVKDNKPRIAISKDGYDVIEELKK